jgi:hypothetical protein
MSSSSSSSKKQQQQQGYSWTKNTAINVYQNQQKQAKQAR